MSKIKDFFKGLVPGKQTSFQIFQEYEADVARFLRIKTNDADAEELLSRVRLSFDRRLESLRDTNQVKNLIFQIVRDELKSHWTSRRRELTQTEYDHEGNAVSPDSQPCQEDPEEALLNKERLMTLRDCLLALQSPKMKNAAVLHFVEYKKYEEIREIMDVPLGTVQTWIRKSRINVTDCMRNKMALG